MAAADTTEEPFRLKIDGREYTLDPDDLELGEVEVIEEEFDAPMAEIDFSRAKGLRLLTYVLVHRDNPKFTMEDARKLKLGAFGDADEPNGNGNGSAKKRPTKAASSRG